jgi:hypothetical protein
MPRRFNMAESPARFSLVVAAVVATAAGMLWLHQSSALATTGRRIWELDRERQALLERRANALVAYAAATDPLALEARARALGFGPAAEVAAVVVPAGIAAPATDAIAATSPLALTEGATVAVAAERPALTEQVLGLFFNQAAADERQPPDAVGSAP